MFVNIEQFFMEHFNGFLLPFLPSSLLPSLLLSFLFSVSYFSLLLSPLLSLTSSSSSRNSALSVNHLLTLYLKLNYFLTVHSQPAGRDVFCSLLVKFENSTGHIRMVLPFPMKIPRGDTLSMLLSIRPKE